MPLVIECVAEFVSDHASCQAVVNRIVHLRIEKRRLQNSRGEDNYIERVVVISLHALGKFVEFAAINWLSDLGQLAVEFELLPSKSIAEGVVRLHFQTRVIAPMGGIADHGSQQI